MKIRRKKEILLGSLFILFSLIYSLPPCWAVSGSDFEYHGYFRAGSGSTLHGGDQLCFQQPAIPGNEFRLGNECSIYGEAALTAWHLKAAEPKPDYFKSNVRISYAPQGVTTNESLAPSLGLPEAYIEAGNLNGSPLSYWVGKRFYRDAYLNIDDFFYFADASGSGAGVKSIPTPLGGLDLAILTESGIGALPVQYGRSRILFFDARIFGVKITQTDLLDFWAGYGAVSGGNVTGGGSIPGATGAVIGVKYDHQLKGGWNRISLLRGSGVMQGLTLNGTFLGNPNPGNSYDTQNSAGRWRVVEDLSLQPFSFIGIQFAGIYETWKTGSADSYSGKWTSLAIRPTYYINDYYSVDIEGGYSWVTLPGSDTTQLTRVAIAPTIHIKPEILARPVLRIFLADTFGKETSYGVQGEVWF